MTEDKCSVCDATENLLTDIHNKLVCESCYYDDDPIGTVKYPDGSMMQVRSHRAELIGSNGEAFAEINSAAELDFTFKWVSRNAWRGYYAAESKDYKLVHSDAVLAGSDDAKNLEQFGKMVITLLKANKIRYAIVSTSTSNICSSGLDFFVHNKDMKKYKKLESAIDKLESELRDSDTFKATAYGLDKGNKTLMTAVKMVENGIPARAALEILLK
jgi:hypothetical protein